MAEETENFAEKFSKKIKNVLIDPNIFTYKFVCSCQGECCNFGVYTDLKEYYNILLIKDKVKQLFDETQSKKVKKWFEPPEEDEDFESGVAVGTEVIKGKCTFLDRDGLCTLQKLALIEGEHKWKYKPLYCILFPFTVYEGVLTIDDEHIDRLDSCNVNPNLTIFEAVSEELKYFFGEDGFAELEKYREEYLNEYQLGVEENAAK
ncbi:MAG: DUF3109 family protein [Ignavibacteria bacterium]|nr:DUF3109 family protein [Ignavibacteria bacterium]MBT8383054.1 DUF3109 family protein [Ignavibacteria bacterium]MBT8391379.1 DUF3109 family protein [Ignavibacteria bacterium]NNJ53853.1 DUF3109 family protein [Ignavibacteriaceae bacterium]NNL22169.1 DUF3109 family protein [Ignavibacteriaceae bacterium]